VTLGDLTPEEIRIVLKAAIAAAFNWTILVVCLTLLYTLGMCIAVASSWESQHSILWSAIDGALSWAYLIWHFWLQPLIS
jgi:hypothetical protein